MVGDRNRGEGVQRECSILTFLHSFNRVPVYQSESSDTRHCMFMCTTHNSFSLSVLKWTGICVNQFYVCVRACTRACMCVSVCAHVHAWVRVCVQKLIMLVLSFFCHIAMVTVPSQGNGGRMRQSYLFSSLLFYPLPSTNTFSFSSSLLSLTPLLLCFLK